MQHANSVPASSIRHEAERKPRQEQGQMGHAKSAPDAGTDEPDTSDTPKKTIKQKLLVGTPAHLTTFYRCLSVPV
jgi:hypothetical protein